MDLEVGIELNHALHRKVSKEGAFLYFWALACLAKLYRDNYGSDCPIRYLCSFAAKHFLDQLEAFGSNALDQMLLKQFELLYTIPASILRILRKCLKEGYSNGMAHGKISVQEIRELFRYITSLPDNVLYLG
jgi:hypothetical protein